MLINSLPEIENGNVRSLARCISFVENQAAGSFELLKNLPSINKPVIGFTGPPGVGKSTLVNQLIGILLKKQKKIAVVCIDPSSPFHQGAFLGDRIRMNQWAGNPGVFIRSLSSRGTLGGLHPRIFEITDLLKAAPYDYILIETVGIGQSELEISSVADLTVMILMAGAGDEIQALKSGVLEIADLFVINKADHPGTKQFINDLQYALQLGSRKIDIIETIATENKGIEELLLSIEKGINSSSRERSVNLAEKAYRLILAGKMKEIDKLELLNRIKEEFRSDNFNIYKFVDHYFIDRK
ncbi:MAG TPA: methylmalonyl Co-A mutase-associated GTPase MeaB [Chitinophagaceae bacterium]|jgi:LAO/AO transport system kinase|nr:methylmalonyl Co-A mutase-associated GTPase MeaB [Chitinophagaceae bacterium]